MFRGNRPFHQLSGILKFDSVDSVREELVDVDDITNNVRTKSEIEELSQVKMNETEEISQEKRARGRPKKNEQQPGGNVFANFDPTAGLRKQTLRLNPPQKKNWAP